MEARRSQKRPLGITALVGLACGVAAMGCLRGRRWGYRLAVGLFVVNLIGAVANATLRGELRGLLYPSRDRAALVFNSSLSSSILCCHPVTDSRSSTLGSQLTQQPQSTWGW